MLHRYSLVLRQKVWRPKRRAPSSFTAARLEDALRATQSALKGGVSLGGGITYLNAYLALKGSLTRDPGDALSLGYHTLLSSLLAPIKQLLKNARVPSPSLLLEELKNREDTGLGWDFNRKVLAPFFEEPYVLDPTEVLIESLISAVSVGAISASLGGIILKK